LRTLISHKGKPIETRTTRVDREEKRYKVLLRLWIWHRLQVLCMAEGSTSSVDDSGHSVPDSRPPKPAGEEVRQLEGKWDGAETNDERADVIREAQAILRGFTRPRANPTIIRWTEEWKQAIALDERTIGEVMHFWDVSEREVGKCKSWYRGKFGAKAA
jgi:hypothetical protein